jgi:ATP-dependent Clp protease protease subunit
MKHKYFSLEKANQTATINIYGDICSWACESLGEVSSYTLSKQLEALGDVNEIHVFINSYGGEVAEGLAIYSALRRHKAKVTTYCDGFACSIASVIFMAGDERVMNEASLLMIHNAWTWASGNAEELRKQADDLEKITQASVEAYKAHSSLSEEEIKALMDAETWILPSEALEYGFATTVDKTENKNASQSSFKQLMEIITAHQEAKADDDDDDNDGNGEPTNEPNDNEPDDNDSTNDDDNDSGTGNEPTDDDDDSDNNDDDDNSDDGDKTEESAQQMLSGFFNAILKK